MSAMPMLELPELIARLRDRGLIAGDDVTVTELSGGVSSRLLKIGRGARAVVVKQALARLKVRDDWAADPARNRYEQAYLRYAAAVAPGHTPALLAADDAGGFFVMEYLGEGWVNWKTLLLAGVADPEPARLAGEFLGAIHRRSWGEPRVRAEFDTARLFRELRTDPYLRTTAERCPAVAGYLRAEAERLEATGLALVHGDFSPKNMLVRPGGLRVLDCEVAWFGDPVFDRAFLINHFLLKSIHRQRDAGPLLALAAEFAGAYRAALGPVDDPGHEARLVRLLLLLLLARVHGKSPVEYLAGAAGKREAITRFVHAHLPAPPPDLGSLLGAWRAMLGGLPP